MVKCRINRDLRTQRSRVLRLYSKRNVVCDPVLELTMISPKSPCLTVDYEVQLSTPSMTNADDCFSNYSKMNQPIRKRESTRKGERRAGFMPKNEPFLEHGQPHARVDLSPTS
jgi:hypothetical protein